jgi:hypothetical protein
MLSRRLRSAAHKAGTRHPQAGTGLTPIQPFIAPKICGMQSSKGAAKDTTTQYTFMRNDEYR